MKIIFPILLLLLLLTAPALAGDYALDFTTGNDHVEVPYDASLNLPDGVTLEAWVELDALGSQVIIAKPYAATHTSPFFEWLMYYQANGLVFRIGVDAWSTLYTLTADVMYHVVMTADGTKWRLYVDGAIRDSTTRSRLPANTNSQPVLFGQNAGSGEELDGTIDEVKIYNRPLTAAQISTHYNSGSGTCSHETDSLKGDWHFNEGSGATTADNSGEGNTGDLSAPRPTWVAGIGLDCHAAAPAEVSPRRRKIPKVFGGIDEENNITSMSAMVK